MKGSFEGRAARLVLVLPLVVVSVFAGLVPARAAAGGVRVLDYSQCANGKPPSTSLECPEGWINGILQGSNSHYREGEVTPQRAVLEVPKGSPATGRTLTFGYQARKGSTHAYDSLATWNFTQTGLTNDPAHRCQGLLASQCPTGSASTFGIPDDETSLLPVADGASPITAAHMVPAGPGRVMTMFGGQLTNVFYASPAHDNSGGSSGDDYATVNVEYRVADVNPADGKADANTVVQLLFGGHTAASIVGDGGWGTGLGSSNIDGGPYHIKWAAADGESAGRRDNQIMGAAILAPSLQITKAADAATVTAGQQIGFLITVTNPGGDARKVVLSDPLPVGEAGSGISWSIESTTGGPSCSISPATGPDPQTLTCTMASLAGGGEFSVHVVSPTSGATGCTETTYTNSATVSAENNPPQQASATTTVNCPGLAVDKQADAATVSSGQQIGFRITVSSTGPGPLSDVSLTDALPVGPGFSWSIVAADTTGGPTCAIAPATGPGAQTLTCTKASMAAGTSFSVHVVSPTGEQGTCTAAPYPNRAEARAANHPRVHSEATVTVQCPVMTTTKLADSPTVDAGEQIGFVVTVSNAGPGTAFDVSLTDALPVGPGISWSIVAADTTGGPTCSISPATGPDPQTLTCTKAEMGPGTSFSVHMVSATAGGGAECQSAVYPNTAEARARNHPVAHGTDSVTVNCPGVQASKVADNAVVDAGEQIGFRITVSNTGTGNANNVSLTDALPVGPGISWSIVAADTTGDPVCAIAPATGPDPQTLTCTKAELAPGASFSVHIVSPTAGGGPECIDAVHRNTAEVRATNHPLVTAEDTVTVNCPVLTESKTADNAVVDAGEQIGFRITVSNTGTGNANNVSLTDALPVGPGISWSIVVADTTGDPVCAIAPATGPDPQTLTCTKAELAPGASFSVHIVSPTAGGGPECIDAVHRNTAEVRATNHPLVTAEDTVTVNCPVLTESKTADNAVVDAGEQIGFRITVSNTGTGNANNVSLTDALPVGPGISWSIVVADTTGDPVCAIAPATGPDPQTLTCTKAELAPGASFSVHIVSPTAGGGPECIDAVHRNTAEVRATNHPLVTAEDTVTVNCPVLTIVKTADSETVMGGLDIGFRITVSNTGTGNANNVSLTDALPVGPGFSWSIVVADTTGDPVCAIAPPDGPAAQTLTCTKAELAPGASFSVHIVSPTSGGADCVTWLYSNTATAQAVNHPQVQSTASIQVNCPRLSVTKTQCPGLAVPGGYWPYTLTFTNSGDVPTTSTAMKDTIPAGTSVVDAGGGSVAGGVVTWNLGTLNPGATGQRTLTLLIDPATQDGTTLDNLVELTSDQVTAPPYHLLATVTTAGAATRASSYGLKAEVAGITLLEPLNPRDSAAPGPKQDDAGELLSVPVSTLAQARVLRGTAHSRVNASPDAEGKATSTATATAVDVNVLNGTITADTVTGVSQTVASALGASYNSRGSRLQNLVIAGVKHTNVAPNTHVTVKDPLLPTELLADVYLYEQGGASGLSGDQWTARHFVNMIRVVLLKPWRGFAVGTEIVVSHAESPAEPPPTSYPSGLACGPKPDAVSAKAYTAFVEGLLGSPPQTIAAVLYGLAEIPATGGSDSNDTPTVIIPPATGATLRTTTVLNTACGSVAATNGCALAPGAKLPYGSARSVVHDTNILNGLVTARVLDVTARSTADGTTIPATVLGATFVDLKIAGVPVLYTPAVNGPPIIVPLGVLEVEIRLNEQILGGTGPTNTEGTVNAIHVIVYSGSGATKTRIGEIIVASAHSDAHNL